VRGKRQAGRVGRCAAQIRNSLIFTSPHFSSSLFSSPRLTPHRTTPQAPPCWTTIIDLEESCAKEMIQLVPTVIFTSLRQSLPVGALKHLSHPMIQIVLLLEERAVAAELMELEAEHDMGLGHQDQHQHQHQDQDQEVDEEREGSASRGRDSPQPRRVITSIDVENAARAFCAGVLSSVSEARGYQSTVLVSSAWTRRVAQPLSMALRLGLECCERPAQLLFPGGLFVKPLVAAQELVRGVASAVQRSLQLTNNVCVLPAFVDSEFMVPGLLVKYAQFLHGGFAWNFGTAMDILWVEGEGEGPEGEGEGEGRDTTETEAEAGAEADGTGANGAAEGGARCGTGAGAGAREGRFDGSIARDVLSLALFKRPADEAGPEAAAILSLLTGELFADGPQGQGQGQGAQIDFQALAAVDRVVWAILTSPASVHDIALPPKTDFALCLKVHKRLLNAAKWHPSSTNGGSNGQGGAGGGLGLGLLRLWGAASPPIPLSLDLDEFLSVVHLASVVTRAIVLAYSVHDKATAAAGGAGNGATGGMVTLGAALAHLPPGLNSDVANSLLEGLERCVGLWRRRFRSLSIFDLGSGSGGGRLVPFRQARARFFRGQMHGLPALAFLGTRGGVRDKLPRPTVVDDTFTRLFAESA